MSEEIKAAEPASTVTLVTSENRAEFMAKKLDIVAPEPVAAAEETTAEPAVESEAEPVETQEPAPEAGKKPNPKIEKRFSDLTQARKTAEESAARERERADTAERTAAELRAKYEPPVQTEELGPEPQASQFQDVGEYAKALKDWTAENTRREIATKAAEKTAQSQRELVVKTWREREDAYIKEHPEYAARKAAATHIGISDEIKAGIEDSSQGPALVDHFIDHPEDVTRIGALTVGAALRELGKIEAKLEGAPRATKSGADTANTPAAEISKAPPPITPLRSAAATPASLVDDKGEFHGTFEQYKAARRAGKIK